MPSINRILCPVDFSEASQAAFQYADDFAASVNAKILLVHAFDNPASYDREGQKTPADATIAPKLEALDSQHDQVELSRLLHAGDAGQVICWTAEDQDCDLIIMGTHGRTGLAHLLFGSTAEYVLQHARCPVLTIRQQKQGASPLPEPFVSPLPAPPYM